MCGQITGKIFQMTMVREIEEKLISQEIDSGDENPSRTANEILLFAMLYLLSR